MNIHDLNTKTLTDPAYVAFDDGSDTYKANFKDIIDNAAAEAVTESPIWDTIETAINDLNSKTNNMRHGTVSGITNSSNYDLVSNGILTKGGAEIIFLVSAIVGSNSGSVYYARTTGAGAVYLTAVHEGSGSSAPIISGNGILNLRSSSTAVNIGYEIFRLL